MTRSVNAAARVLAKFLRLSRSRVAADSSFAAQREDSAEAEEERYRQLADDASALNMPFSDLGATSVDLYRLGLVLAALDAGPRYEVLDFGAGTCWTSAFLNRMGLKTVALDISATALEIGRKSFALDARQHTEPAPEFHTYDGRHFPFEDDRFDGIVSFAAFHHVPNQEEILREMFRVTAPGGRVVFNEPLLQHAATLAAQSEVEAYGVLERDIDPASFEHNALDIGFERLVLKPYSQTPFDELTSNSLLRNVAFSAEQAAKRYLDSYSVFYLQKPGEPPRDSSRPGVLRAEIEVSADQDSRGPDGEMRPLVTLHNTGDTLWLSEPHPQGGYVTLGCQLLTEDRRRIDRDYQRFSLPSDVPPGATLTMRIKIRMPRDPGTYTLKLDLVNEGVCWFEDVGSTPLTMSLERGERP